MESNKITFIFLQTVGGGEAKGRLAGGVAHAVSLASTFQRWGHKVLFLTNQSDTYHLRCESPYRVRVLPCILSKSQSSAIFLLQMLFNFFLQYRDLRNLSFSPNDSSKKVVVGVSPYFSDVAATILLSRRLRSTGVVYFYHVTPPAFWFPSRRGGIVRAAIARLSMTSSLTLTKLFGICTAFCGKDAPALQGLKTSCPVVDVQISMQLRLPDGWSSPRNRGPELCFVGRVSPQKGVSDLIDAWARVVTKVKGARLHLVGRVVDQSFLREVRSLLRSRSIEGSVSIHGYIDDFQLQTILDRSRGIVIPSYEEGWSIAAMDALSHGTLPIVYDLPAYKWMGDFAVRIKPGSIAGLANGMLSLLERDIDHEKLAQNAKALLTRYDEATVADNELHQFIAFDASHHESA